MKQGTGTVTQTSTGLIIWTRETLESYGRKYMYTSQEFNKSRYTVEQQDYSNRWRACFGNVIIKFPFDSPLEAMQHCESHYLSFITNRLLGDKVEF